MWQVLTAGIIIIILLTFCQKYYFQGYLVATVASLSPTVGPPTGPYPMPTLESNCTTACWVGS